MQGVDFVSSDDLGHSNSDMNGILFVTVFPNPAGSC